jgi:hypothetical protein
VFCCGRLESNGAFSTALLLWWCLDTSALVDAIDAFDISPPFPLRVFVKPCEKTETIVVL